MKFVAMWLVMQKDKYFVADDAFTFSHYGM